MSDLVLRYLKRMDLRSTFVAASAVSVFLIFASCATSPYTLTAVN
jgi:hypothetical protein